MYGRTSNKVKLGPLDAFKNIKILKIKNLKRFGFYPKDVLDKRLV